MINSRAVARWIAESWITICFPHAAGFLAKAISFPVTPLQQRQSISLVSFLQFLHLHQSRFFILICNKSATEPECLFLFSFSWFSFHTLLSVHSQTEMVEEWWSRRLYCCVTHIFLRITFFIKTEVYHCIFSISFTGSKFNVTWKTIVTLILKTYVYY